MIPYGKVVLLIDPDAVLVNDKHEYRLVSSGVLRQYGLRTTSSECSDEIDRRKCIRTGRIVPVSYRRNVTVLDTVKRDARNYRNNKGVQGAVMSIKQHRLRPCM